MLDGKSLCKGRGTASRGMKEPPAVGFGEGEGRGSVGSRSSPVRSFFPFRFYLLFPAWRGGSPVAKIVFFSFYERGGGY